MDAATHKRFLEYRERHVYFGAKVRLVGADEFVALEAEYATLHARGEGRDDEEEARYAEVAKLIFRD